MHTLLFWHSKSCLQGHNKSVHYQRIQVEILIEKTKKKVIIWEKETKEKLIEKTKDSRYFDRQTTEWWDFDRRGKKKQKVNILIEKKQ